MYLDFFKNVIKDASVSGIESKLLFIQFLAFRLINYCYIESLDDIYIYIFIIILSFLSYRPMNKWTTRTHTTPDTRPVIVKNRLNVSPKVPYHIFSRHVVLEGNQDKSVLRINK